MKFRKSTSAFVVLISIVVSTINLSHAQSDAEATSVTIGTESEIRLNTKQIEEFVLQKGIRPRSQAANRIKFQFTGKGAKLDTLNEKDVLDLWIVLTPDQRERLVPNFKPGLYVPPLDEFAPNSTFSKIKQSYFNIPPPETSPPSSFNQNGRLIPINQIKKPDERKIESNACETASVDARFWVGNQVESDLIHSYEESLNKWVNTCMTQDSSDTASLAGLNLSLIKQVVGILSYGPTRFCTGILKDGMVITAKHCFMNPGEPDVGLSATWSCPGRAESNDFWCTTDSARNTLQFSRASDPSHPIPLSLAEANITEPTSFGFKTDRISLAIRSDNLVSLAGLPKVEWDMPKVNELVWLAGPVISATSPDKYQGLYWSKFLDGKCRIVEVKGQCVRHYCQALGGFSGSPMITGTSTTSEIGTVKVAGFHLGASESYKECESDSVRLNIAHKSIQ